MKNLHEALEKLNKEQREAVEIIYGPVMVLAGPGTGKTQILALRIANILDKGIGVDANNILCLTFTEAGAHAMRERLKSFIGKAAYSVGIFTFHGFANTVINDFPEYFSFSRNLNQLDDVSRLKIIRQTIDELPNLDYLKPFYNQYAKEGLIISAIQTLKKEGINHEELNKKVQELIKEHKDNPKLNKQGKPTADWKKRLEKLENIFELVDIYGLYQSKLTEEGFYDYEDMILFVGDELKENNDLRSHFFEKYQFVLVDEYQDTNGGQNEILKWLCSYDDSPNIFVVGDDDQAIYRFQGANLENILSFNTQYKDVKTIAITKNYRSTQIILDIASSIIQNNTQRLSNKIKELDKTLEANFKDLNEDIELHEFEKKEDEYTFIARKIEELLKNGINAADIAVIYRKNSHGLELNRILNTYNIPTDHKSSDNILNSNSVNNLIHLLKVIELYKKNVAEDIYRAMLFPFFKIPVVDVYKLVNENKSEDISFVEKVLNISNENENLFSFNNHIQKWHRDSANLTISNLLLNIIKDINLFNFIPEENNFDEVLSLISFFDFAKSIERINGNTTLNEFLNDIELIKENNYSISKTKSEKKDGIKLLTAHSSKGLEFEHVFIIHATENNWGNTRKQTELLDPEIYNEFYDVVDEKLSRLEDERRLFFVAVTRAKRKIYFTKSDYDSSDDSKKLNRTQFIEEINKEKLSIFGPETHTTDINDLKKLIQIPELESYSKQEQEYLLSRIENFSLSATALNDYIESPLKFKERHLIRIPSAKNKHVAMGTGIHAALELLNIKLIKEQNLEKISLAELESTYRAVLKKEFEGDEEYEITLEEGISILKNYYEYYIKTGSFKIPVDAEYNFRNHNVILDIEEGESVRLSGKIDKVELIDKDTNSVRIVDYKTSKPQTENQIKGNTKNSDGRHWRQLVFYKLLCELDPNFKPKDKYNSLKYICDEVQIDYLRDDKGKYVKRTFKVNQDDLIELKKVIKEVMKNIRKLNFPKEPVIDLKNLNI